MKQKPIPSQFWGGSVMMIALAATPLPLFAQAPIPIVVERVVLVGNTVVSRDDVADLLATVEGKTVTLDALQAVAAGITQRYHEAGYITSSAVLGNQAITPRGEVTIQVVEAGVDGVVIEGTRRLRQGYLRDRLAPGLTRPLQINRLETALQLLRRDPLLKSLTAQLEVISPTQTQLRITIEEAKSVAGEVQISNDSPASVGSERLQGVGRDRNLTGRGDQLQLSYARTTTGGSESVDLAYSLPLNPQNGTLSLRTVFDRNRITQVPLDAFDITGASQLYQLSWRQPLYRTLTAEFALSLDLAHRNGQTFLFGSPQPFGVGPDEDGVSRTTVIRFGQDYLRRDLTGVWSLRSQFNIGTGWLAGTINAAPTPDSRFFSWSGQVQRIEALSADHLIVGQLDVQLTPDSLLPSEQFVIGGRQSLRGYRQNARSADNGLRVSLENRITLERDHTGQSVVQLIPFLDSGAVWNHPDNPNTLLSPTVLLGAGVGLEWMVERGLTLTFDYGLPLIPLSDAGDNAQDLGIYFQIQYGW
ncbi:ShlB/FhaC/HecB family hemolysin secretion/activation protein [Spirulina major]|uniref:ShlB/FhaC/HecB family hemolysin secretion/activation protein n=1 Tax=Spirulina major TaxID=270636 RepID=UPI001114CD7A|nr:ShlB/FhaC/HecB family hemolysin secretion/activation protein [Spirulina major]